MNRLLKPPNTLTLLRYLRETPDYTKRMHHLPFSHSRHHRSALLTLASARPVGFLRFLGPWLTNASSGRA